MPLCAPSGSLYPIDAAAMEPVPPSCHDGLDEWVNGSAHWHYEILKYCQSTGKVHAKVLQNLIVIE